MLYLDVTIDDVTYCGVFHVSSEEPRAVLGMDFLERYNAQITVGRSRLTLDKRRVDIYNVDGVRLNHHSHRHQSSDVCGEAGQELEKKLEKKIVCWVLFAFNSPDLLQQNPCSSSILYMYQYM